MLKKKIWANFQRIIELFTKKIVKKLLKIWSWDPGSGKNLFRIPDSGSRGQKAPDPGSRIRIRNTGYSSHSTLSRMDLKNLKLFCFLSKINQVRAIFHSTVYSKIKFVFFVLPWPVCNPSTVRFFRRLSLKLYSHQSLSKTCKFVSVYS